MVAVSSKLKDRLASFEKNSNGIRNSDVHDDTNKAMSSRLSSLTVTALNNSKLSKNETNDIHIPKTTTANSQAGSGSAGDGKLDNSFSRAQNSVHDLQTVFEHSGAKSNKQCDIISPRVAPSWKTKISDLKQSNVDKEKLPTTSLSLVNRGSERIRPAWKNRKGGHDTAPTKVNDGKDDDDTESSMTFDDLVVTEVNNAPVHSTGDDSSHASNASMTSLGDPIKYSKNNVWNNKGEGKDGRTSSYLLAERKKANLGMSAPNLTPSWRSSRGPSNKTSSNSKELQVAPASSSRPSWANRVPATVHNEILPKTEEKMDSRQDKSCPDDVGAHEDSTESTSHNSWQNDDSFSSTDWYTSSPNLCYTGDYSFTSYDEQVRVARQRELRRKNASLRLEGPSLKDRMKAFEG